MKARLFCILIVLATILATPACKKDKSSDDPSPTSTWDLLVQGTPADTFVIATGVFTFGSTTFSVHIRTSRIGGGNIVKEFDMSGQMAGDSLFVNDYELNLTDPIETAWINGRMRITASNLTGNGTYKIVQPPDTISYSDTFIVSGTKR